MSRPLARIAPSLAWSPSTVITVPARSDCLLKPRRSSALGAPASTIQLSTLPSGFLMSMWIHACGLIHSIDVTVPVNFTGFWASYSAANEWCATTGTAANSRPTPTATTDNLVRIDSSLTPLFYNRLPHGVLEISLERASGCLHHDNGDHVFHGVDVHIAPVGSGPAEGP